MTQGQKWFFLVLLTPALILILAFYVSEYRIRSSPVELEPIRYHTVRSGDTVWQIVEALRRSEPEYRQYDTRDLVDWVLENNNIRNPGKLEVGRKLVLP